MPFCINLPPPSACQSKALPSCKLHNHPKPIPCRRFAYGRCIADAKRRSQPAALDSSQVDMELPFGESGLNGSHKIKNNEQTANETHKQINERIINLYEVACNSVYNSRNYSPEASLHEASDLFDRYSSILKLEKNLNYVNISTMLYRTAIVAKEFWATEILFDKHRRYLIMLVMMIWKELSVFEPRHLANIVWAFGKMGRKLLTLQTAYCSFPELYSALLQRIRETEDFKPQEIVNIIGGFADLKLKPGTCEETVSHLSRLIRVGLEKFTPRAFVGFLWALGTIGYLEDDELIDLIVCEVRYQIYTLTPQGVTNFLWGLAKQGYKKWTPVYLEVEEYFIKKSLKFIPQGVSNIAWSFAKLRHVPSESFFTHLESYCKRLLHKFNSQQVANLIYSYAIFGRKPSKELLGYAKDYYMDRMSSFQVQSTCNFLWALAMLGELDRDILEYSLEDYFTRPVLTEMNDTERRQLYQCLVQVEVFCGTGPLVEREYRERLEEVWMQGQEAKRVSPVALSVLITLQKLGFVCQSRYSNMASVVDVALEPRGQVRLAVEISISSHFFLNKEDKLEGPRLWAMRLLEKQGYQILRINEGDWLQLEVGERTQFIIDQLSELGIDNASLKT